MLSNGRKMKTSTNKRHHGIRPASYLLQKYIDKDPTHLKSILCKLNQEKHSEVKNSLKQYFTGTEFNHTFVTFTVNFPHTEWIATTEHILYAEQMD